MLYLQTVLKENPDSSPAQSLGEELPGLRCKVTNKIWFLQVFRYKLLIIDYWLLITDYWLLIIDYLHMDDTEKHGCPQADGKVNANCRE